MSPSVVFLFFPNHLLLLAVALPLIDLLTYSFLGTLPFPLVCLSLVSPVRPLSRTSPLPNLFSQSVSQSTLSACVGLLTSPLTSVFLLCSPPLSTPSTLRGYCPAGVQLSEHRFLQVSQRTAVATATVLAKQTTAPTHRAQAWTWYTSKVTLAPCAPILAVSTLEMFCAKQMLPVAQWASNRQHICRTSADMRHIVVNIPARNPPTTRPISLMAIPAYLYLLLFPIPDGSPELLQLGQRCVYGVFMACQWGQLQNGLFPADLHTRSSE